MSRAVAKTPDIQGESQQQRAADAEIAMLADRQQGVVAYRQLVALGLGPGAIEHRIKIGRLYRRHHGVYAVGRSKLTPRGHLMAAALALGPDAVISHRSAAALWGLRPTKQLKIDVTVPGTGRHNRRQIRVHRSITLRPEDLTVLDGIPVTSLARTILDVAALLTIDQLIAVIEEAERRGLFDLRAIDDLLACAGRHKGARKLRKALADYKEPPDTRSELERRFIALLDSAGLPRPETNVLVAGVLVDCFYRASRLVIELDSRRYHSSPRAFETDRRRDAILMRADCRVLRITDRRMKQDPQGVIDDVIAFNRRAA